MHSSRAGKDPLQLNPPIPSPFLAECVTCGILLIFKRHMSYIKKKNWREIEDSMGGDFITKLEFGSSPT